MRVISENKNVQDTIDFAELLADLQEKHSSVYWLTIDGQVLVYRALGRLEYRQLLGAEMSDLEKEDIACKACLLFPTNFDFDECPAGVPTELFTAILKNSFLDSFDNKRGVINYHRHEMEEFDNQITCIINEAFPEFGIEEIENWDMAKTAKYLSRAEWKLNVLRNIPLDYDLSDHYMAKEWNKQHGFEDEAEEEEGLEPKVKTREVGEPPKVKKETLEERQARMAQEAGARKKTPEEVARMKQMFPEIDWDAGSNLLDGFDESSNVVDTISPALRTGW